MFYDPGQQKEDNIITNVLLLAWLGIISAYYEPFYSDYFFILSDKVGSWVLEAYTHNHIRTHKDTYMFKAKASLWEHNATSQSFINKKFWCAPNIFFSLKSQKKLSTTYLLIISFFSC